MSSALVVRNSGSRRLGWCVVHTPTGLDVIVGWRTKHSALACIDRLLDLPVAWSDLSGSREANRLPREVRSAVRDEKRAAAAS